MATTDAGKEMTRAERIFVRISVMQTVLAIVGMFVGVGALYAAMTEADAARKQQKAAVLPDISTGRSFLQHAGDRSSFEILAINAGIGPGRISAMRVTYDGKAVRNWRGLLTAAAGDEGRAVPYGNSQGAGTMVQAGQKLVMLDVHGDRSVDLMMRAWKHVNIEICYCSVFGECWIPSNSVTEGPTLVRECPDYGNEQFQE